MPIKHRSRRRRTIHALLVALLLTGGVASEAAFEYGLNTGVAMARVTGGKGSAFSGGSNSLQRAAKNATRATRGIVGQLIAIALCVAAAVLIFKRDFAEAAAVFVVGMLALLLVDPAGISLLKGTVRSLFGH